MNGSNTRNQETSNDRWVNQDSRSAIWMIHHKPAKRTRLDCMNNVDLLRGNFGHLGLIMAEVDYWAISNGGVKFVSSNNLGVYPTIPTGATMAKQERLMAIHKVAVKEYETCLDVRNTLKAKICKAIELIH